MIASLSPCLRAVAAFAVVVTAGCSAVDSAVSAVGGGVREGTPGYVRGFLGGVAADEPRAALAAREVLSSGGSAADAAVALGHVLFVTLPSRAGLLGGGACLVFTPQRNAVEALVFPAEAPGNPGGDRPAAAGSAARGLFALHARHGRQNYGQLLAPAEQMARLGVPLSRALARDLQPVSGPLFQDPGMRAAFGGRSEGDTVVQPELGGTLAQIRVAGVGDLHQGALARRIEEGAPAAGAALTVADLRAAVPRAVDPVVVPQGNDRIAFLPSPADPGLTQAALAGGGGDGGGGLPASTSFAVLDRGGMAVSCVLTQNNLFGTGRTVPGTGILLAAAPTGAVRPPVMAAAIAWNPNLRAFRAAVAASGQGAAPLAAAQSLRATLAGRVAAEGPEPGRANAIGCARYLPGSTGSCAWVSDPRGAGIALGGDG